MSIGRQGMGLRLGPGPCPGKRVARSPAAVEDGQAGAARQGLRIGRPGLALALSALLLAVPPATAAAGDVDPAIQAQLDAMRQMLEKQNEVIQRQNQMIERLERRLDAGVAPVAAPAAPPKPAPAVAPVEAAPAPTPVPAPRPTPDQPYYVPPVQEEDPIPPVSPDQPALIEAREEGAPEEEEDALAGFEAGYEKGFVIRTKNPEEEDTAFLMRINGRIQFRYTLFERTRDEWIDGTGQARPIRNRSDFEIERARLTFSGYAISPRLQYFINLDGDTDDAHRIVLHDMWFNYEFNRYADIHIGKAMVPGSRDWLNGSTRTRFADRSMATTFFRPDRSIGIFSTGEPLDNFYYEVQVANGIATSDLEFDAVDKNFAFSTTMFWDPWGNYGKGYVDLEWHEDIAALVGTSFTYAGVQGRDLAGVPYQEFFALRLLNGSRVVQDGLFAPDVSVSQLDFYLWAIDAAMKWRGFSANSEFFFRWLDDLEGNGPIPVNSVFNWGFYLEAGYMFIPERMDFNVRTSQILGDYGYAAEYAGALNYYVFGTQNVKLTTDLTRVLDSPTSNSGPGYRPGDDGWMWRVQMQVAF